MDAAPMQWLPDVIAAGLPGLLIKGALLCLLGLSLCRELSMMPAVVRYRIALSTIICLAALPLLAWVLIPWELSVLPGGTPAGESALSSLYPVLLVIYLGVATFLLAKLCLEIIRTAVLSGRAIYAGDVCELAPGISRPPGATPVRFSGEIRSPLTWGWLRPAVLLPHGARTWPAEDVAMALQHELAHIERADWAGHLLSRCVHALYWPVPGMRSLLGQLSLSAEQACDDRVLATGASAPSYAAMLLRQARGNRVPASVALGQYSELGIRIRYMVADIVDHSVFATGAPATFAACIALTIPLATVQLGTRPDLPEPAWGSVAPNIGLNKEQLPAAAAVTPMRIGAAERAALGPGPERPNRPPVVQKPPRYKAQEKPSIPPP